MGQARVRAAAGELSYDYQPQCRGGEGGRCRGSGDVMSEIAAAALAVCVAWLSVVGLGLGLVMLH